MLLKVLQAHYAEHACASLKCMDGNLMCQVLQQIMHESVLFATAPMRHLAGSTLPLTSVAAGHHLLHVLVATWQVAAF
jgi:hypothetical protein